MGVGVRVETVLKAMPLNEISKKKKRENGQNQGREHLRHRTVTTLSEVTLTKVKLLSTALIIREMQIKMIRRYHLTPFRMAIIKKNLQTINVCRKGNPSTLLTGVQTGAVTRENSMVFP